MENIRITIAGEKFMVDREILAVLHEGKELDEKVADLVDHRWVAWRKRLYFLCEKKPNLVKAVLGVFRRGHTLNLPELPPEKKGGSKTANDGVEKINIPAAVIEGRSGQLMEATA